MKQPSIIQAAGHNCTGKASAIQAGWRKAEAMEHGSTRIEADSIRAD
jgi:hypothetical protein